MCNKWAWLYSTNKTLFTAIDRPDLAQGVRNLPTDLDHKRLVIQSNWGSCPFREVSSPKSTGLWVRQLIQKIVLGLPWWRSGWESACRCRGHGFEPWSGKIPHATGQLGPWATITEPACLEPVLRNRRGRDSERPAHRDEEWPPLAATRESPRTETKTQHSHK